jgi:hypothetical protein
MAVDVDMGLANLHLLLGMRPEKTVMEVIERGASLDDIAEIGPVAPRRSSSTPAPGSGGRPPPSSRRSARSSSSRLPT